MYYYLDAHPDIFMSRRKEPRYFGSDLNIREGWRVTDEAEYLSLFRNGKDHRYRGEASVFYLYSKQAPAEIKRYSPLSKIIIMLRNPVDALVSMHRHYYASCNEDIRDVEQALAAEPDRRSGRRVPADAWFADALLYTDAVSYASHVQRYMEAFAGDERLHVIIFDDFANQVAEEYRRVLQFLELDCSFEPTFDMKNAAPSVEGRFLHRLWNRHPLLRRTVGAVLGPASRRELMYRVQKLLPGSGTRQRIEPDLRGRLRDRFRPDVERLSGMLGRDLMHWVDDPD